MKRGGSTSVLAEHQSTTEPTRRQGVAGILMSMWRKGGTMCKLSATGCWLAMSSRCPDLLVINSLDIGAGVWLFRVSPLPLLR